MPRASATTTKTTKTPAKRTTSRRATSKTAAKPTAAERKKAAAKTQAQEGNGVDTVHYGSTDDVLIHEDYNARGTAAMTEDPDAYLKALRGQDKELQEKLGVPDSEVEAFNDFVEDVQRNGFIHPANCTLVNGKPVVSAGIRRWFAARALGRKLPYTLDKVSQKESFTRSVSENQKRQSMTVSQTILAFRKVKKLFGKGSDAARALGVSHPTFSQYINLESKVPASLIEAADRGNLTSSALLEISKLEKNHRVPRGASDEEKEKITKERDKAMERLWDRNSTSSFGDLRRAVNKALGKEEKTEKGKTEKEEKTKFGYILPPSQMQEVIQQAETNMEMTTTDHEDADTVNFDSWEDCLSRLTFVDPDNEVEFDVDDPEDDRAIQFRLNLLRAAGLKVLRSMFGEKVEGDVVPMELIEHEGEPLTVADLYPNLMSDSEPEEGEGEEGEEEEGEELELSDDEPDDEELEEIEDEDDED